MAHQRAYFSWGRGGFEAYDFERHRRPHWDGHQHGVSCGEQQVRSTPRHVVAEIVLFGRHHHGQWEEVSSREVKKILKDAIAEEDNASPCPTRNLGSCSTRKATTSPVALWPNTENNWAFPWPASAKSCDEGVGPNRLRGVAPVVHAFVDTRLVDVHRWLLDAPAAVCLPLRVAFDQHSGTCHLAVALEAQGVISDLDIRKDANVRGLFCWCWPIT